MNRRNFIRHLERHYDWSMGEPDPEVKLQNINPDKQDGDHK